MTIETPCANIDARGRALRMAIGAAGLGCAVVGTLGMAEFGFPRAWRVPLFVPFVVGVVALLEARASTCVVLAARGQQQLDGVMTRVTDVDAARRLRSRGHQITRRSLVIAAVLTLIALLM